MFEVGNLKDPVCILKQIYAYIKDPPIEIGQRLSLFDWVQCVGKETLK